MQVFSKLFIESQFISSFFIVMAVNVLGFIIPTKYCILLDKMRGIYLIMLEVMKLYHAKANPV